MPGVFFGSTEITDVGKIVRGPDVQEIYFGATKIWPSAAPPLPTLFEWNQEIGDELPATATFTRASRAQVLTTTDDTTFWYQETKSGELRLHGLRRVRNLVPDDPSTWNVNNGSGAGSAPVFTANFANGPNGETGGAIRCELTTGGTGGGDVSQMRHDAPNSVESFKITRVYMRMNSGPDAGLRVRAGGTDRLVTATSNWQLFSVISTTPTNTNRIAIRALGSDVGNRTVDLLVAYDTAPGPLLQGEAQDGSEVAPSEDVKSTTTYNAVTTGVRYFATTNGNTVDPNYVVTEAPGTTITFGGYLPEPAATFQVTQSEDLSDGSWTTEGLDPLTDLGVSEVGFRTWRIDAGTGSSAHRIFKTFSGTGDASVRVRARAGTGQFLVIRAGLASQTSSVFDLVNGIVTQTGGSTSATTIDDLGGGWYECTVAKNAALAQQSHALFAISDTGTPASDSPSFAGSNETIDLAIPAGENTLFSTTSEPTAASTVTRVADVLSDQAIPSEFGALFDFTAPDVIGTGNTISLLGAGTSAVDIIRLDASFNVIMADGGTPTTIGAVTAGQRFKVSYGRDATGRSASLDGATAVNGDAPSAAHEGESFQLYSTASVNQARGIGHLSILYSVRPSDSQLESLSA